MLPIKQKTLTPAASPSFNGWEFGVSVMLSHQGPDERWKSRVENITDWHRRLMHDMFFTYLLYSNSSTYIHIHIFNTLTCIYIYIHICICIFICVYIYTQLYIYMIFVYWFGICVVLLTFLETWDEPSRRPQLAGTWTRCDKDVPWQVGLA